MVTFLHIHPFEIEDDSAIFGFLRTSSAKRYGFSTDSDLNKIWGSIRMLNLKTISNAFNISMVNVMAVPQILRLFMVKTFQFTTKCKINC